MINRKDTYPVHVSKRLFDLTKEMTDAIINWNIISIFNVIRCRLRFLKWCSNCWLHHDRLILDNYGLRWMERKTPRPFLCIWSIFQKGTLQREIYCIWGFRWSNFILIKFQVFRKTYFLFKAATSLYGTWVLWLVIKFIH